MALHELGHAVEQTLNLQDSDYYVLGSIPNIAFTEALAFVFQDRDMDVLGIEYDKTNARYLKALDSFWSAYEIMGVSLVDMKTWNWLYKNPNATADELANAVISFAKETWNRYYAPVFKVKDQTILAIYSHMIDSSLYLPDYPLGHVIQFQVENYLEGKVVGPEMERMCKAGKMIPQLWMKNAVGEVVSVKPLLKAVKGALEHIKK
jgi:oligoendopeptidase F